MRRTLALLLILTLHFAASTSAFDGEHTGFALGGGVGVAPLARWSTTYEGSHFRENNMGVGPNLMVGYGWDQRNLLALELNTAYSESNLFDLTIIQGFAGLAWYHYYRAEENSLFSVAGIGVYRIMTSLGGAIHICINCPETLPPFDAATGVGYLVGGGCELAGCIQIGMYVAGGRPSERGHDYGSMHVALAMTAVLF